jgi:hypothetical protein
MLNFDPSKIHNYYLVKAFKENISHITLLFHFSIHLNQYVATLVLGSQPRQRVARLWAKRKPGSHTARSRECGKCEGMNPHTPKATPTLGDVVLMDSRIFRA